MQTALVTRRSRPLPIVAASLSLALAACAGLSSAELRDLGAILTPASVNFGELYAYSERARTAYAAEADIRLKYPATVVVGTPGEMDVQYFLEQDDKAHVQYVAVRGTVDKKNWSEDLEIKIRDDETINIPVHEGFDNVAQALYSDIKPHLDKQYETYLTGHSLGGAIAALLAIYLIEDGYDVERVVTFGQPKFTTAAGVERLASLPITRVIDENDIVPMLPPPLSPHPVHGAYQHVGPEVILLEGPHFIFLESHNATRLSVDEFWRSISFANVGDHQMTNYQTRLLPKAQKAVQVPYNQREQLVADDSRASTLH
jgi:hypothetical protein